MTRLDTCRDVGFLAGGGELGALISRHDWSRTSVGALEHWPSHLRTIVATILHSAVPIVTLWHEDGVMIYNDAYSVFAGGRHPALLGSKVREGWPEVADFNDNIMKTVLAGGTLAYRRQELTLYRSGAPEQVWLDLDYSPVFDAQGRPDGVIAVVNEATEAVLAERWQRAERERLRQMFEQAPNFMSMKLGPDHRMDFANPAYHRLIGARDAVGKPVRDAVPELIGQGLLELLDQAYATGEARHATAHPVRLNREPGKPAELRYLDCVYQPVRDAAGQVIGIFALGNDVTDRVDAERLARENDANFRAIAEVMPHHVWTTNAAGEVEWVNARMAEFSGLSEAALLGWGWASGLHPDDAAAAHAAWRAALQRGDIYESEFRLRRADGVYRWFLARGVPVREDGRILRWVGTGTDIEERKAAEAASTRDRDRSWTLSPVIEIITTPAYDITAVNPAWTSVLGWTEAETVGRSIFEFIAPKDVAVSKNHGRDLAAARASGTCPGTYSYHTVYLTKAGEHRQLAWIVVPEGGRIYGFGRDVTAEIEAGRALAGSLAERDRIWSSTNDLMGTATTEGRLLSVNPAWSRLLGYGDEVLLGTPLLTFIAPEDHAKSQQAVATLAAGRAVADFENRLVHQDGRVSLISWAAEPVEGVFHMVGRDITQQRAAEEALRQSQKMEAVGQLTGGIAHDFNNLLQGITGSLDLLAKRVAQGRASEIDRFITGAMGAANRASALTHRLLAFSRRQPLDPRAVRANPLVTSMEDLLRRTLGEHVALELVLAAGLWLTLCDAHQLENAILNLAINARDAMPDGGRLIIETANAELDDAYAARLRDVKPGQYVCICVTDTGTGMTPDVIEKAFEPFFTTKPIGQGTGLGLSMIYGFARQSEGYVKIYSEVGRGTTVKLYLPRHRGPDDHDAPEPEVVPPAAEGETVLVIEDEPVVRGLIIEVLEDLGYAALEAADGPAGLAILQSRRRIDLLITDIGLPGLNGRQVADAARVLRPALKVLFMTGYAENAAFASGFLEPGMVMITKPFAMEALGARVRGIIEGS